MPNETTPAATIDVNLNDEVEFTVREPGIAIWNEHWRDSCERLGRPIPPIPKKTQLWDLMNVFGPALTLGLDPPIETTIRIKRWKPSPTAASGEGVELTWYIDPRNGEWIAGDHVNGCGVTYDEDTKWSANSVVDGDLMGTVNHATRKAAQAEAERVYREMKVLRAERAARLADQPKDNPSEVGKRGGHSKDDGVSYECDHLASDGGEKQYAFADGMGPEGVRAELAEAGIDMRPVYATAHAMIDRARNEQAAPKAPEPYTAETWPKGATLIRTFDDGDGWYAVAYMSKVGVGIVHECDANAATGRHIEFGELLSEVWELSTDGGATWRPAHR